MLIFERWKIKRELQRIFDQLSGLVLAPYESWARNIPRNNSLHSNLGAVAQANRIAVFVVYQPCGISPSTFRTVRHLSDEGYATLLISNAALSVEDRSTLEIIATTVIERPNFGYDFGAYQAAIHSLQNAKADIDTLLLLNDSVWFPVRSDSNMLRQMESHKADVVSVQIFGEALNRAEKRGLILGSYCLMFNRSAYNSAEFRAFWKNYRMSSSKEVTVRRGERALSRAMQDSHLTCAGLFSQKRFEDAIRMMRPSELRVCIEELVVLDPHLRDLRRRLLNEPASERWSDSARTLVIEVSKTKNFVGSSPRVSLENLGVEVVKKNNEMLYRLARQRIIRWTDCELVIDPQIHAEILMATERDHIPLKLAAEA